MIKIIRLGSQFTELSVENYQKAEIPENKKEQKILSAVFLSNEKDAPKALSLAEIAYEGELELSKIEFCKAETQQQCLAGSLRIPRFSDVRGSKIKIQFFINSRNIVIIDESDFSERILRGIRQSRVNQGSPRELFLYNYISQFMNRDLEYLGRYEKKIMKMEEDVTNGKTEEFLELMYPIRRDLLILREYYDELRDLGKELEENKNHFFARKYLKYFGTIADRADRLMGRTMHLIDYMNQVRNEF